jgi:hypothetical protein
MAVISLVFSGTESWGQGEAGAGGVGAEGVKRLQAFALVMGAAGGLAVDGDEVVPARPHRSDEGLEAAGEQDRIDPVQQVAQPAGARHAMMEVAEPPEEIQVALAPHSDRLEIVAAGDGGAGDQQQHFLQRVGHPPALAIVVDLGEVLQQHRQAGGLKYRFGGLGHVRLSRESEPHGIIPQGSSQNPR